MANHVVSDGRHGPYQQKQVSSFVLLFSIAEKVQWNKVSEQEASSV